LRPGEKRSKNTPTEKRKGMFRMKSRNRGGENLVRVHKGSNYLTKGGCVTQPPTKEKKRRDDAGGTCA